jgi:hypothetical protein
MSRPSARSRARWPAGASGPDGRRTALEPVPRRSSRRVRARPGVSAPCPAGPVRRPGRRSRSPAGPVRRPGRRSRSPAEVTAVRDDYRRITDAALMRGASSRTGVISGRSTSAAARRPQHVGRQNPQVRTTTAFARSLAQDRAVVSVGRSRIPASCMVGAASDGAGVANVRPRRHLGIPGRGPTRVGGPSPARLGPAIPVSGPRYPSRPAQIRRRCSPGRPLLPG